MATPRDLLGYRQPSLLGYQQQGPTWSQEEIDAATIQRAQADRGSNALVQGWQATGAGINAGDLGELALAAEQAGDKERAAGLLRRMRVAQAQSQVYAPDTRSVGDVLKDPTRVANWAGGVLGSMARSAAPAVAAGAAGAGAGALLAGVPGAVAGGLRGIVTYAPAMAVSYDQLRGENVAQQYDDPEVMKRSADDRALAATKTAALQTIPETIVPMRAVGAMIGRGTTPAARAAAKAVQNRPMDVLKDSVMEAGTEVLQKELDYQGLQALGSTAERQPMEYLDAALAGAVGGGGVSGASNALGAAGDKLATLSQPVAGGPTDKEVLGAAGSKVVEKVKDALSKPFTQTVAEMMTPDKAVADSLNGNQDPEAIAAAISELDQTVVPTAENMVDELLKQDRVSASDKARLAQLKGTMADPVARNEVGVIAIKTKATEVLGAAFTTVSDYVKRVAGKIQSKFSMEGMDIAPLVDAMAPIFGETAPERAQKLVELASKYEGITSAEAITDSKLADSLEQIADMLDAMGKNGEGIKKALSGVGMTSLPKLIDELNTVPGAQADLGKQDSFLRTMLQKGQRGVSGKKVARAIDDLAPKFAGMSPEAQAENLSALSVAFGSPETVKAVLEYYAPIRTKALEAFRKQTDALTPLDQRTRGITRPPQAEMEAAEGQLTEGDYTNKKASYRDSNPARPFFAMSDRKELKAEVAKGGVVAGMDEYVRRTGRSAAEAFGRVKADLEQRLKASRNRDKGWLTQELERAVATGADLRTRQELEKRLAKAEVRTDLPKLERQYAKMLRDTPAPEDMDPKRFDRALSRYRVVLRDETDTQASDEDIHRFQRLLRVRKAIKPPQPPEDVTDTEAKADYENRLAAYQAKVGAIDETTITFTKTDGKKLKTSAESMTYASQVKGGDLQKFLSAVSSVLDRDDIAGVELPSTLTVFRQGEKRQRRTLAEMRGIAKVRKQLQARAESSDPKQKAFAEQALALIDETTEQRSARETEVLRNTQLSGKGTRRERAVEKSIEDRKAAREDAARDEAFRAQLKDAGVAEEEAVRTLAKDVQPRLRAAVRELKENPGDQRLKEEVANLRSEARVLAEAVQDWLDKVLPLPDRQEYTSRLADDVQMEGGYTEEELQAAYLDEVVGVLEQRLALVKPTLTKEGVKKLYELNNQISAAIGEKVARKDHARAEKLADEADKIAARVDPRGYVPLVKTLQRRLDDTVAQLNELMDSTGRNPRDGSRRVKDNPSRESNAAVRAEQDELAQSLMSAELDPKTIPMMELSFQGKIDELRKKGGVDAAETLRAYQFAMGRLRRIKGKRKGDDAISYTVGPDGKPQALPLDPETAYGRVEPDMRSETERSAEAQDHATKTRRVADAKLTTSTEKREDMTTLERFNPIQRASFERRKEFAQRMLRLQKAVKEKRAEKQKELNPEAAAQGADADKKNLAAREAMKGMGRSPVAVKGELNSTMLRTVPGETLAMMTAQLKARQEQVVKVVDVLTETLKRMLKNRTDSEAMAGSVDLLERLERIGSQTPAIPKGFTGAREGRQSSNAKPITEAPVADDSNARLGTKELDREIAAGRARLKLAKSKRPADKAANFQEKMEKRKAAALERAATKKESTREEERQVEGQGRREEGRREEVLKGGVKLPQTSPYVAKDQAKSDKATKFIGRGSVRSSTAAYAAAWGNRANTGTYTADDVVFVSAEGNRGGRIAPNWAEIKRALDAGATIVTDVEAARARPYNVGEREVAAFLAKNGYMESSPGTWTKGTTTKFNTQSSGTGPAVPTTTTKLNAQGARDMIVSAFQKAMSAYRAAQTFSGDRRAARDGARAVYQALVKAQAELAALPLTAADDGVIPQLKLLLGRSSATERENALRILEEQYPAVYARLAEALPTTEPLTDYWASKEEPRLKELTPDVLRYSHVRPLLSGVLKELTQVSERAHSDARTEALVAEGYEADVAAQISELQGKINALTESMENRPETGPDAEAAVGAKNRAIAEASAKIRELRRSAAPRAPQAPKPQSPKKTARAAALKDLQEALERMRGPDVKLAVQNLLSGYGKYERTQHGPLVERLITISHAAPNKMSVLYHEALHDFFAELGKDPATLRIKQQLLDAASTGHVQKQLRELLKNEPAALAQLSDPEERLAYMFQFRMADPEKMRIGPNTDTLFQRIAAAIRKFTRLLTTNEKAEQILLALYDGRLANPSTAAKVMAEWNTVGDHFERFAGPVKQVAEKMFSASTSQLRAMNIPAFNTIADLFEDNVKKTGLLTARAQSGGIWRTKLERLLAGHSEKEIKDAMIHMQSMKDPVTDLHKKLAGFFVEIREWQIGKGVKQFTGKFNPATGEPMYEPMGKVKRYFPRVVDLSMLTKNGPQFSRLLQKHMGYSQKQADDVLHQLRVGDQMLVKPHGVNREAGFSPYAQSVISRELILDEAGATELAEAGFWSQDFAGVMTRYIDQAVHRAEYTERFGNIGEGLDDLMEQAKNEGATKDQLERAKRLISGLDGTIHRDMNPSIRQMQMALLTLQNAVLLPLAVFSQMIDPLGIAVRSGDVRDAGAAYKRVLTDIAQWASPKPDRAREMAEIIGTVQKDSVLQAMGMVHNGMYMSTGLRKINNFIFKYNGMQGINNSFRTAAVIAAEKYILEHRNDARRMEELDLTPADIKEVKPGEIDYTSEKIQQALFRFADGAVVRPNAAHRPLWMSDPRFMLVAHLKQFAFSFQEVILKRVAHEKSYGNSGPLKVLAMYAPIMFAADMAKWMLFGGMPQGWSYLEMFAHAVHRSGLLGVGTFGADAVQDVALERNPILGALGPTAEHLGLLASWIGGGVPLEDVVDRSVPLARLLTK